jgi:hypothetical protein
MNFFTYGCMMLVSTEGCVRTFLVYVEGTLQKKCLINGHLSHMSVCKVALMWDISLIWYNLGPTIDSQR